MEKQTLSDQPIEKKKSRWWTWLIVIIIVIVLLGTAGCVKDSYDFSDPKYETESFEINLVDMPQIYESGFAFNCTVIQNSAEERVDNPNRYRLIKNNNILDFIPISLNDYVLAGLNTPKEFYEWRIYPNGSIKPTMKFNEPLLSEDIKESKVIWLCQKIELSNDIFQPPEGVDFEAVSTSWEDLQKKLGDIKKSIKQE